MAGTASNVLIDSSFSFTADQFTVSPQMKEKFDEDGYVVVRLVLLREDWVVMLMALYYHCRSLLNGEELKTVKQLLEQDEEIARHSYGRDDGHGRTSRMCLWHHPGEDITGMVDRCEKVVNTMGDLLGGEVYHYHTKLIMKEAHTGGSFVWHQDYG